MFARIDNYLLKKFGKKEKMDINDYIIKYNTMWSIIFFLNLEDAFVTLVAVKNLGVQELNPLMNLLLSSPPIFIIIKMILLCLLFVLVYKYLSNFEKIHKIFYWYVIILFVLVDVNNLTHVIIRYMMIHHSI